MPGDVRYSATLGIFESVPLAGTFGCISIDSLYTFGLMRFWKASVMKSKRLETNKIMKENKCGNNDRRIT